MKQAKSTKPAKSTNHSKKKPMKKRSKAVKAIVITLTSLMAVVAVLFIGGGIYLWNLAGKINYDDPSSGNWMPEISDPAEIDPPDPIEPGQSEVSDTINPDDLDHFDTVSDIPLKGNTKDIFNILLLGIDGENNTYSGRSDSNIIVSVNTKLKTIKLVSPDAGHLCVDSGL